MMHIIHCVLHQTINGKKMIKNILLIEFICEVFSIQNRRSSLLIKLTIILQESNRFVLDWLHAVPVYVRKQKSFVSTCKYKTGEYVFINVALMILLIYRLYNLSAVVCFNDF